ncbi:MAG: glycosyltransferase [Candidatus Parvarchaeota archaeon]|nr:glycosyltransferase [Candidatus Rehaiarchaeum fermentans]
MDNYISVIVTAYNRKEFLLNALKSAVNQTLDRKFYEIIVVKNFNDNEIDNYIQQNNIKEINMDGTVGEF